METSVAAVTTVLALHAVVLTAMRTNDIIAPTRFGKGLFAHGFVTEEFSDIL